MKKVYGIDETYYDESPEQVALDYFNYEGGTMVQVKEADSYMPTCEDEIAVMESEEWDYLVRNMKPFMIYGYDEKNNSVFEINTEQVR